MGEPRGDTLGLAEAGGMEKRWQVHEMFARSIQYYLITARMWEGGPSFYEILLVASNQLKVKVCKLVQMTGGSRSSTMCPQGPHGLHSAALPSTL